MTGAPESRGVSLSGSQEARGVKLPGRSLLWRSPGERLSETCTMTRPGLCPGSTALPAQGGSLRDSQRRPQGAALSAPCARSLSGPVVLYGVMK